ncbi:DMT family transporter [Evansella clarkii]|jgi:drug/metabolite transporter (DMT)-like permease|uniref:DMT family transporter n=1 Tax=Evansella clarkii TaxID=79879 RepID=UPI000996F82C|nr:DMT family transporter [Evansella clarkii]
MHKFALLLIILGAALWGSIGIFVQALYDLGFTPIEVVTIRVTVAFIFLVVYLLIKDAKAIKIKWKHFPFFIGTGICSIVLFNWAYFTAIQEMNLSVAAVLLYTGPVFVTILARIFFKELLTKQKIAALCTTFIGCIFVIGLFPLNTGTLSFYGIMVGLISGFGYALYSIFGKAALSSYSSLTTTTYTFLVASAALLPTTGLFTKGLEVWNAEVLWYSIGLGLLPTVVAYLLYTTGLHYVESSKASIASTIEPVVAALIGVFIFHDVLGGWQTFGMLLVISAVFLINIKGKQPAPMKPLEKSGTGV